LVDLNAAIGENSLKASLFNNRGNIYFCLKKFPDAINDFNKAIEMDEN
jgi:tetratricopeptide (TPR) repeat protein